MTAKDNCDNILAVKSYIGEQETTTFDATGICGTTTVTYRATTSLTLVGQAPTYNIVSQDEVDVSYTPSSTFLGPGKCDKYYKLQCMDAETTVKPFAASLADCTLTTQYKATNVCGKTITLGAEKIEVGTCSIAST